MKLLCLSLWQPWASVIFIRNRHGIQIKPDETRHYPTRVRGRIAIHAAKTQQCRADFVETDIISAETWALYPFGAILGTVELASCHRTEDILPLRTAEQQAWGNYGEGRFAFELANPILLPEPIPYRGQQGFFTVELP